MSDYKNINSSSHNKSMETDTHSSVKSEEKKRNTEKKKTEILVMSKKNIDDGESESSLSHIKNIDYYDKLNFQRIKIKRSSLKAKTNVCFQPKLNIQKFTDEIIKYVEEIPETNMSSSKNIGGTDTKRVTRQRTIKFATQKVTFQYAKEEERVIKGFSEDLSELKINEEDDEDKLTDRKFGKDDTKGIFTFGQDKEDDEDKDDDDHKDEEDDENNKHISLNVYTEENHP